MTESEESGSRSLTLIQSLQRGLRLIEVVVEQGPTTARGLSKAIGLGLPTTYHLLRTLVHEGYLGRLSGGLYALGPQLHSAAELEKQARTVRVLRETMSQLRDQTNANAIVAEFDDGGVVITHISNSPKGPRADLWVGTRLPAHATAVGKALIAQLDASSRDDLLGSQDLKQYTSRTILDPKRLAREIESSPVAYSNDQYLYGVSCMAVPLAGFARPAALAVSFNSSLATKRQVRLELLLTTATESVTRQSHGPEAA